MSHLENKKTHLENKEDGSHCEQLLEKQVGRGKDYRQFFHAGILNIVYMLPERGACESSLS